MTTDNAALTALVDRYIAAWNETDASRRQALIALTFTDKARYLDPVLAGDGHDGIDAMVGAVHAKYPGYTFSRTSDINGHHDRAMFNWALGPKDGPLFVKGVDVAVVSADGRLAQVDGFFTEVNAPQS